MAEPLGRITGTEMEWSFVAAQVRDCQNKACQDACQGHCQIKSSIKGPDLSPCANDFLRREKIAYLNSNVVNFLPTQSQHWLENGARWYTDCGEFREYATPEDDSFIGTTANEMVGEDLTARLGKLLSKNWGFVEVNKRVIADDGNVCGYHENYCVDAESVNITATGLALLGVHLATRNIFAGAGYLDTSGRFYLSQKGSRVTHEFHTVTTNIKPVVNLKNEAHAGNIMNRVHVVSGDPNISPWATRMKLGTTSLVLALIEHGQTLPDLRLDNLIRTSRRLAGDQTIHERHKMANGKYMLASDVQKELYLAARQLSEEVPMDDEHLWTLEQWDKAIHDLEQDFWLLRDRADWVLKRQIIEHQHEKKGYDWRSPELRAVERRFSHFGPTGLVDMLRTKVYDKWMPPADLLAERQAMVPPQQTRAKIRGGFIKRFADSSAAVEANWSELKCDGKTFYIKRPAMTEHEDLMVFMKEFDESQGRSAKQNDAAKKLPMFLSPRLI